MTAQHVATTPYPLQCEVVFPKSSQLPGEVLSRWSDSNIELPAMVVRPQTEEDIVSAISLAKQQRLTLIPGNGGHGSFVPITSKTLYLDLKKFNSIILDKQAGTVRIGGGASTGNVIKTVTDQGYYTLWTNSNAVGYVGSILGGGNGVMNGLHGFMVDAVESIELITADGRKLDVSASSKGEEKALFNALCGAGHGLGIITSIVMKVFPLKSLNMVNDSIWVRKLVFPPTAIDAAVQAFMRLGQPDPALNVVMVFARAPPAAPVPGAPMILLTASYYGPPNEGERAVGALFDSEITGKALNAETVMVPMAIANNAYDIMNVHGGYKDIYSCFVNSVTAGTLKTSFHRWVQVGEQHQDAKPTMAIWSQFNVQKITEFGQCAEGRDKFLGVRGRGILTNLVAWSQTPETKEAVDRFRDEYMELARSDDSGQPRTFANNQHPGIGLEELFPKEKIPELKRVKSTWDADRLFWSPF